VLLDRARTEAQVGRDLFNGESPSERKVQNVRLARRQGHHLGEALHSAPTRLGFGVAVRHGCDSPKWGSGKPGKRSWPTKDFLKYVATYFDEELGPKDTTVSSSRPHS
jgi:hypothetical protein